jgi:hypothetical protein
MAIAALRTTLGAIDNAEAVDVPERPLPMGEPIAGAVVGHGAGEAPRRELSEGQIRALVQGEVADRESAQPTTTGSADTMRRPDCAPNQRF